MFFVVFLFPNFLKFIYSWIEFHQFKIILGWLFFFFSTWKKCCATSFWPPWFLTMSEYSSVLPCLCWQHTCWEKGVFLLLPMWHTLTPWWRQTFLLTAKDKSPSYLPCLSNTTLVGVGSFCLFPLAFPRRQFFNTQSVTY